ncbi:MFS family permease [Neisseria sp. HSC-16F19]|nr:YbfB/YjiJ family MFS transporter [Neisseria sp. HSC-16F19]MCP2040787.1 MFS family permease [Neisseria sp. HSC-16F19]
MPAFSRKALKNGLEAALMLAVVMGFGRFAYTALYPYMVSEYLITVAQGSWAASANYVGYLIGALWAVRIHGKQAHLVALAALAGTAVCLLALYFLQSGTGIIVIRLLAGILSALGIVATSMWLLGQCKQPQAVPIMYAGVGLGIALSAEGVVWGVRQALSSPQMWLVLALLAVGIMLCVLHGLLFERHPAQEAAPAARRFESNISAYTLIVLYGLAGFGYIITATYLPLLVKLALPDADIGHIWAVFGLSVIPSCFIWYRICQRWGYRLALSANMAVQALGVLLPVILPNIWGYVFSALLVGGGFMGTVTLVMPLAQQLAKNSRRNLIALATVAYSIGQIAGPLVSGQLYQWTHSFHLSLLLATAALLAGAWMAWKKATPPAYG